MWTPAAATPRRAGTPGICTWVTAGFESGEDQWVLNRVQPLLRSVRHVQALNERCTNNISMY